MIRLLTVVMGDDKTKQKKDEKHAVLCRERRKAEENEKGKKSSSGINTLSIQQKAHQRRSSAVASEPAG